MKVQETTVVATFSPDVGTGAETTGAYSLEGPLEPVEAGESAEPVVDSGVPVGAGPDSPEPGAVGMGPWESVPEGAGAGNVSPVVAGPSNPPVGAIPGGRV